MGRTAMNDDKISEGLLILSCEEDYGVCAPFLEKGLYYFSEILSLNTELCYHLLNRLMSSLCRSSNL